RPVSYDPSPLCRSSYDRLFDHIAVDEGWAEAVRAASVRGHVVYVGRAQSFLDFLGLDHLVKRHGLPLIRFTNDLGMSVVEPFGRGSRRLRLARPIPEEAALGDTIAAGASALLFLRRPPTVSGTLAGAKHGRSGAALEVDLVRTLVELQRKTEKPIILLPQTLVWTKRTPNKQPTLVDVILGPSDWPGRLRTALQLLFNFRNAIHRGGEPFDLLAFLQENQELTDAQAADAVRYALLRRMERERTIILGPAHKTSARLKDELLRSPRLRRHVLAAAKESSRPVSAVEDETRRELDRLAAAPDTNVVGLMDRALRVVWDRIYDGLVVDEEGMARVREAARHGPLVLVPSHKSHVDYLVVSSVFYQRGLAPPLIAAGDNLSFFPLGTIFRHGGAFFIRRSFKGRKLYPHIVDAYIRKVLHEGHSIEVFVEGGRSRTGKLLPPKLGILSMIVDAGLSLSQPVQFVPISIGYERIIEEGSYVRELEGGEKRPEDLGGLLRAPRVLRSRYGRLYLQFGEIFDLATLHREAAGMDGQSAEPAPELSPAKRRGLVSRIAHRITYEIDRVTLVTPASLLATALLIHRKRGIARGDLFARADELVRVFTRLGAPVARTITDRAGALRPETLEQAIALFLDAKLVTETAAASAEQTVLAVPDVRRLAVEYFKNNVLHFFVPSALVASSLGALGWEAPMTELRDRVRELSRFFKLEFQYRADAPFEEIFSDALGSMIEAGEVVWEGDVVRRAAGRDGARLETYAEMIRTYLEAYLVALDGIRDAKALPASRKDWGKATLQRAERAHATGEIALRESVSKPKLETALSAFHELGLVKLEADEIRPGAIDEANRWRALLAAHLG
ncbi:MAG: 1-acyl-sn-glycerol-3-phosphate acyltransferase, partial [Sandaracinaceae bacterium]|nr:1-acyl-sn-glycerol-3-phosphate acyltransferase [Sandaracinaceae bacterium]